MFDEQVAFNSAVNEPGRETPGVAPGIPALRQLRKATSVVFDASPSGLRPATLVRSPRSLNDGTRNDSPQAPRNVSPYPTVQFAATFRTHTGSSRLSYLS